ncbi:MAG: tetratricopeptide repeat protein [Anaerolineales bacterium]|jgi:tetratricopeptide (TPR) repeat protein
MTVSEERYQKVINQGHSAAWDMDWGSAATYYRQALEEKPNDLRALNSLALALYESREYKDSLKTYLHISKLSPKNPLPLEKAAKLYELIDRPEPAVEIVSQAAELYLLKKNVDKAIESWSRVVSLDPKNLRAHTKLALIYEKLDRKDQAVREYLNIASLMQHGGDVEKAAQAVNRALMLSPKSDEATQALGMIGKNILLPEIPEPRGDTGPLPRTDGQEVKKLESQLSEDSSDDLDPISAAQKEALMVIASVFFEQPEEEQRQEHDTGRGLQAIVSGVGSHSPKHLDYTSIRLHLSQAVESQTNGDLSQAAEELSRAIQAGLEHVAVFFNLGYLYVKNGRMQSAQRVLQRSVTHQEYALASRLLLGQTLRETGRLVDASKQYLEALKLADSMVVPSELAEGLRQLYEPIIEAQSLEADESHHNELCESIDDLLVRPRWEEHLRGVREQLITQPDGSQPLPLAELLIQARSSQVVEALSNVEKLARQGYLNAAMEEALFALQYAPTYLPLHIKIGDLLVKLDLVSEAISKFMTVARYYSVRGETLQSIEILRKIVEMAPMELNTRQLLVDQLVAHGDIEYAIDEYLKIAEIYYNLADINESRSIYTEALKLTQKYSVDINWKVRIMHRIADLDVQSLDWRLALRIYKEISKLKPDDAKARQRIVELSFRLGQGAQAIDEVRNFVAFMRKTSDFDLLLEFLEYLVSEYPENGIIRRYLAEQYRHLDQISDAIAQYDTANEIFLANGNRKAAVETITDLLELNPPNIDDYRQLLTELKSQ